MTDYLDFLIEDDADVLAQLAYAEMASRLPGWDPIPGEIDTVILQAAARVASQVRASAGIVPIGVFRYLATQFGLTPIQAVSAITTLIVGANDLLGHTLPAGSQVIIPDAFGNPHAFQLTADAVIPPGSASIGGVPVNAVTAGTDSNGIPITSGIQLVDALPWYADSTTQAITSGGVDDETDDAFLARIVRRFALQSAAPILPADFAALALDILAPGSRAIAIDGYDLPGNTTGNARTVTVFVLDPTGAAVSAPLKAAVVTYLNSLREVNWLNYCGDPVFFDISVKWTAHAIPGFVAATVNTSIIAAVTAYLSAVNWGKPALESYTNWTLLEGYDKVRLGELYEVINNVDGVAYVDTLFLKAGVVAPTTEILDVTLTGGQVVVPRAGSITGTVT